MSNSCINKNNCSLSLSHAQKDFSNLNSNLLQKEYNFQNKLRFNSLNFNNEQSNINRDTNIGNTNINRDKIDFINKSIDFNHIRNGRQSIINENKLYRINSLYNK